MAPRVRTSLALLCALITAPAAAQDPASGFQVRHEAVIHAPPGVVYEALVDDIGQWWNPAHTFSGDARNLSIDARPGGCFCERLPGGGGVEHLRVVHAAPGELLRLSGALGPLQAHGLTGSLGFTLDEAPEGTKVELSYSVGGFMEGGLERIAAPVGSVLQEQLDRLKLFVETGAPAPGIVPKEGQ